MKTRLPKFGIMALVLPLLLAFSRPLNVGSADSYERCQVENNTFVAGESITYKLYYNWNFVWLSAGEVTFRVYDEGDEYHMTARGRTYKSYEWFFTVNDNYDSYIDKETLLPRLHIKDVQEGDYVRYDRTVFNQRTHTARSLRGKTREEATEETIRLDGCVHDILSIVYVMRNLDYDGMAIGDQIPIELFLDRETYPLKVTYMGKEARTKVKGMGRYNTIKISPQLVAGEVFKEGDEMTVYASDDRNKIPLLIESPVSVGSVKAVLKSYSGLKYDFTAKVD